MPHHHPNKVPARPRGLTLRRIFAYWPLLIWLGAIYAAIWAYQQGIVFRRMNGAVDVYQENVSPMDDGNLLRLADGVERGKRIEKGHPVAYMKSDWIDSRRDALITEIEADKAERLRDYDDDIAKLESEKREIERDEAGANSEADAYTEAKRLKENEREQRLKSIPQADRATIPQDPLIAEYTAKIAKCKGQSGVLAVAKTQVSNEIAAKKMLRNGLDAEKDPLKYAEHGRGAQLLQLNARRDALVLIANTSGTIDRINKEPGEFVRAGEGVLKIVADPTQVIGFLPQEHIDKVKAGDKVWITPTNNRAAIYESKVLFLAPRTNSLPNSTSPTPGSRLFGRDVICEFPHELLQDKNSAALLPGQTVIIHIERPGDIPIWNRIFHNDDAGNGK